MGGLSARAAGPRGGQGGRITVGGLPPPRRPTPVLRDAGACLSATNPASLDEASLNGAAITVSLVGLTFASGVSASSFALVTSPTIAGLSISRVTGGETVRLTFTVWCTIRLWRHRDRARWMAAFDGRPGAVRRENGAGGPCGP